MATGTSRGEGVHFKLEGSQWKGGRELRRLITQIATLSIHMYIEILISPNGQVD